MPAISTTTPFSIDSDAIIEDTPIQIVTKFQSRTSKIIHGPSSISVKVETTDYLIKTDRTVPKKLGLLMIGWGGNNGSTLTAALIANRKNLSWKTRRGEQRANFYGSLVMASTIPLGYDESSKMDIGVSLFEAAPFVHPSDIVVGGWDISRVNLADALDRARVLEPDLISQVRDEMSLMAPLPSIYVPSYIASNQAKRADNVLRGTLKENLETIRQNIR